MKKVNYSLALNVILSVLVIALVTVLLVMRHEVTEPVTGQEEMPTERQLSKVPKPKGSIVIIIDDFGYRNDEISDGFLALDVPITCAIIPGHRNSATFAQKAISAGKEVIIHMPMESHSETQGEDEYILKTVMTSTELESRIRRAYSEIPQAIGMNNHQGSKATEDSRVMRVLALTLKDLGKFFVDSRTTAKSIGEKTMQRIGVKTRRRNVFLDNEFDPALIQEQLVELVEKSDKWGLALGIGHAKQATLSVLESEIPRLQKEGYSFTFVSEIVE